MVFSTRILGGLRAAHVRRGFLAAVLGTAALAGCGQKGTLFLPVPPQIPVTAATATAPAATASASR